MFIISKLFQSVNIGQAKSFNKFGTKFHKTPFPGCEHLQFNSNKYWECCIRKYASSLQHQVFVLFSYKNNCNITNVLFL